MISGDNYFYSVGTVSVTNGSRTVTGSGTGWVADNVARFGSMDEILIQVSATDWRVATIYSLDSATQATLAAPWEAGTVTGAVYRVSARAIERETRQLQALSELLKMGSADKPFAGLVLDDGQARVRFVGNAGKLDIFIGATKTGSVETATTLAGQLDPAGVISLSNFYTKAQVDTALGGKSDSSHNHDGSYYTKSQVDTALGGKAGSTHNHDGSYYTKSQVDTALGGKSDSTHDHDSTYLKLNPSGGVAQTLTGSGITLQAAWPVYSLRRTADTQANAVYGRRAAGHAIWGILLGEGTTDDFLVSRWNLAGAYLDVPLRITYAGDTLIGVPGRSTTIQRSIVGDDRIELGALNSGDRAAYIDFHSAGASGTLDFSARILRNAGVNGALDVVNTGTGGVGFHNPIGFSGNFGTSGQILKTNAGSGPPSWVGLSSVPYTSYTVATLPSAASNSACIVYCSNCRVLQSGGALQGANAGTGSMVSSNGASWFVIGTNITAQA